MNYALMVYSGVNGLFNVGDYIQSIAARQFLPKLDGYINRESLCEYSGDKVKMLMNGWFTHDVEGWPPNHNIEPLFISFHLSHLVYDSFFNESNIKYLKENSPIGCRDLSTLEILNKKGVESYFSACLTLSLSKTYKHVSDKEGVLFVDPLFNYPDINNSIKKYKNVFVDKIVRNNFLKVLNKRKFLAGIFGDKVVNDSKFITHIYDEKMNEDERFSIAEKHLNLYANAKLVITSRIHCALPCVAMRTPVLFIDGFDAERDSRFKGLIDYIPRISVEDMIKSRKIDMQDIVSINKSCYEKIDYLSVVDAIEKKVAYFV